MDGKGIAALAAGAMVGLLAVGLGLALVLRQGGTTAGVQVLHGDAGGSVVELSRGQIVELDLGPGYATPTSSNQDVLDAAAESGSCQAAQQCWRFAARAVGLADLSTQRRAVCSPGEACPQFIFLWQVHVRVNN